MPPLLLQANPEQVQNPAGIDPAAAPSILTGVVGQFWAGLHGVHLGRQSWY